MRQLVRGMSFVLILATSVYALSHPDFTGRWKLDLDASDKMDDFAKFQGRSWIESKLIGNMPVSQIITQSEESITITIENPLRKQTEVMVPNGRVEEKTSDQGNLMKIRSFWSDDGMALMNVIETQTPDGKPVRLVVRRTLSRDGQTMFQHLELIPETGEPLKAKRVFRKAGESTDP